MSAGLTERQVANGLCKWAPRMLLDSADWYYWPTAPIPCIHVPGACSHTAISWFDPKRKGGKPVLVTTRAVPSGWSICRYCATEVIRRYRPVARKKV